MLDVFYRCLEVVLMLRLLINRKIKSKLKYFFIYKGPGVSESPIMSTTTSPITSQSDIIESQMNIPTTQFNPITSHTNTTTAQSSGSGGIPNCDQTEPQQQNRQVNQELQQFLSKQRDNIELQNKGFESMKILMNHIQKTSENFLAVERLRMQSARGNLFSSTAFLDENETRIDGGTNAQSSPQDLNIEVTKALNDSLTALKTTLESNNKKANFHVPRKYTLNPDANINIWMDKLRSELATKDLLDVIDSTVTAPNNLDEETFIKRK